MQPSAKPLGLGPVSPALGLYPPTEAVAAPVPYVNTHGVRCGSIPSICLSSLIIVMGIIILFMEQFALFDLLWDRVITCGALQMPTWDRDSLPHPSKFCPCHNARQDQGTVGLSLHETQCRRGLLRIATHAARLHAAGLLVPGDAISGAECATCTPELLHGGRDRRTAVHSSMQGRTALVSL